MSFNRFTKVVQIRLRLVLDHSGELITVSKSLSDMAFCNGNFNTPGDLNSFLGRLFL